MRYVNLLLKQLHQESSNGGSGVEKKALNIEAWYNYATFDLVGDLVFGQSFGCLEGSDYHPWGMYEGGKKYLFLMKPLLGVFFFWKRAVIQNFYFVPLQLLTCS